MPLPDESQADNFGLVTAWSRMSQLPPPASSAATERRGRQPLSNGMSITQVQAIRVARRVGALSLVFAGAAAWQLYGSGEGGPEAGALLPATAIPVVATESIGPAAQLQLLASEALVSNGNSARQLTLSDCPVCEVCPQLDFVGEYDALLVRTSQLERKMCPGAKDESIKCDVLKQSHWGFIFLYILGIFYTFMALAIVCDEFFVPSLECFCAAYDITPDVAGATFMAAGGSMPELFTSFIGTFKETDVGMAAIVGSAVFNVLFVIATCAVASEDVLNLTWWPLARDCSYYLVTLCTVAIFFSVTTPKQIDAWEAAILLLEYIGYCIFMKFNKKIYHVIAPMVSKEVAPLEVDEDPQKYAVDAQKSEDEAEGLPTRRDSQDSHINANFLQPSTFRTGIVQLLVQNEHISDTAGMAAVVKIAGNLRETFDKLDKDQSGHIDDEEFRSLLIQLGLQPDTKTMEIAMKSIGRRRDGTIGFEDFKKWYLASEARIEIKMRRVFERFDRNQNGFIEEDEVFALLKTLGHNPTKQDIQAAITEMKSATTASPHTRIPPTSPPLLAAPAGEITNEVSITEVQEGNAVETTEVQEMSSDDKAPSKDASKDGREWPKIDNERRVTFEDFSAWYQHSLFWKEQEKHFHEEEQAADAGFSIEWPEGATQSGIAWYIATYPLCAAMYITMPDCRKEGRDTVPIAFAEFLMSLIWIGFFALCLVDWLTVVSNSLGVPIAVSAVTILAAGTSIPDLLSSYIVAKQGEGDMAVSSSIGSNIFDITVGLPLPWLTYYLAYGKPVIVNTESLISSLWVLVLMIAAVVITIKIYKWKMTKSLGYAMFVLYIFFMAQDILKQIPTNAPVLDFMNKF